MLLPAISAMILPALKLSTTEFGYIVSAYSLSAGASALIISPFADRFERKRLLLFLYTGFLIGILLSALAQGFYALLAARVLTGIFGGVIAAICFTMVSEVFSLHQRGRAMGLVQMAFAFSQILGLPAAVFLASRYSWQFSYFIILGIGILALLFSLLILQPLYSHLAQKQSAWNKIRRSISNKSYWLVYSNNALIVTGDVLFMTFASAFFVGNQEVTEEQLAIIFGASGIATIAFSPLIGRLADKTSHYRVFLGGTLLTILCVGTLSVLNGASLALIVVLNTLLFVGIAARMICSGALGLEMPSTNDRGSFMTFDSALQQILAGISAAAAGWIVIKNEDGLLENYPYLAILVIGVMICSGYMTYKVTQKVQHLSSKP